MCIYFCLYNSTRIEIFMILNTQLLAPKYNVALGAVQFENIFIFEPLANFVF